MIKQFDTIYTMWEICEQVPHTFETYSALYRRINITEGQDQIYLLYLQKATFSFMLHSCHEFKKQYEILDAEGLPSDEEEYFMVTECKKLLAPIMEEMNKLTEITNGHDLPMVMLFWDIAEDMELEPYSTDMGCLADLCSVTSKLLYRIFGEEITERTYTSEELGKPVHFKFPAAKRSKIIRMANDQNRKAEIFMEKLENPLIGPEPEE